MFILSKLFGVLTAPLNLALALLAVTMVMGYTRWRAWQRPMLSLLVAGLLTLAILPWDALLIAPLENRYPRPNLPAQVDGVIVLGGALDPVMTKARDQVAAGSAVERLTTLVLLGRRFPDARLVFTGGSGSVSSQELKEAPVARRFLAELGFDVDKVVFEEQSRNTRENATLTKALMRPAKDEVWVLVTSALHMPRAVAAFTAVGWPVVPYPVDYISIDASPRFGFNLSGALGRLDVGLHEWMGLVYYRIRGWSHDLFPGP